MGRYMCHLCGAIYEAQRPMIRFRVRDVVADFCTLRCSRKWLEEFGDIAERENNPAAVPGLKQSLWAEDARARVAYQRLAMGDQNND